MTIATRHFGAIEVPEAHVIDLPAGLPGFPEVRRFTLIERAPGSRFRWLQSIDKPTLAFVVVDPQVVRVDYPADAARRELEASGVGLGADEPIVLLAVVTVPPEPEDPSVNLLAPIAVGVRSRRGAQVILHDSAYSTREPLAAR